MEKVQLTLLKKYVEALEKSLDTADSIKEGADAGSDVTEYMLEMARAAGISMAIMQEASMLVGDMQQLVKSTTSYGVKPASDPLSDLFSKFKLGGTKN
jgi:hypothetical protein